MGTKIVGKLDDWTDGDTGGNDFMTLEEGSNIVRIVTSPYQFYVAWTQDASGQNRKIRSAVEGCPLVQRGEKIQPRWFVGVLHRENNGGFTPKILEAGRQIFQQIVALRKREKWGDPRAYDINIERQPKGSQPLYVVMPEPKDKLSEDEIEAIKATFASAKNPDGRIDLGKMTEAPTPEEVRQQLGIEEKAVAVSDDSGSDDDDDFNFDDV